MMMVMKMKEVESNHVKVGNMNWFKKRKSESRGSFACVGRAVEQVTTRGVLLFLMRVLQFEFHFSLGWMIASRKLWGVGGEGFD